MIAYISVGWISSQQRLPVTSAHCATHFINRDGWRAESTLTGFENYAVFRKKEPLILSFTTNSNDAQFTW